MDRLAQQSRRSGLFLSPAWQVPEDAEGKLQIHLDIEATDRRNETLAVECVVDASRDGVTGWSEVVRFTWNGQEKRIREGFPTTGPAVRHNIEQPWGTYRGLYLRAMVTAPRGVTYSVDMGIVTPKELAEHRERRFVSQG